METPTLQGRQLKAGEIPPVKRKPQKKDDEEHGPAFLEQAPTSFLRKSGTFSQLLECQLAGLPGTVDLNLGLPRTDSGSEVSGVKALGDRGCGE